MKKIIVTLFAALLLMPFSGHSQLTINITSAYQYTPLKDSLFLSGTFNAWVVNSPAYVFSRTGLNTFSITINPAPGTLQFKVTRGSWTYVEANSTGGTISNRSYTYAGGPATLNIQIAGWQDIGGTASPTSASPNVYFLDTDFPIPQLSTSRRIWIYLPPDYASSSKKYPVLYMHDGQNLFDVSTSFSGEWRVDESLDSLFTTGDWGIIVVGIDNGGANRLNELSPWNNPSYGGGEGGKYMDFIEHNLKPYIDSNFRTYTIPKFNGIMGSSMGGLISQYGGVDYQQSIKKVGLLSPSFWFTDTIFQFVHQTPIQPDMKFYFVSGTTEDSTMVPLMMAMQDSVIAGGLSPARTKLLTWADGQHAEWFWAREFPAAYLWLFNDLNLVTGVAPERIPEQPFRLYPNPASDGIYLETGVLEKDWTLELYTMQGTLIVQRQVKGNLFFNTSSFSAGGYLVKASIGNSAIFWKKLLICH